MYMEEMISNAIARVLYAWIGRQIMCIHQRIDKWSKAKIVISAKILHHYHTDFLSRKTTLPIEHPANSEYQICLFQYSKMKSHSTLPGSRLRLGPNMPLQLQRILYKIILTISAQESNACAETLPGGGCSFVPGWPSHAHGRFSACQTLYVVRIHCHWSKERHFAEPESLLGVP